MPKPSTASTARLAAMDQLLAEMKDLHAFVKGGGPRLSRHLREQRPPPSASPEEFQAYHRRRDEIVEEMGAATTRMRQLSDRYIELSAANIAELLEGDQPGDKG